VQDKILGKGRQRNHLLNFVPTRPIQEIATGVTSTPSALLYEPNAYMDRVYPLTT